MGVPPDLPIIIFFRSIHRRSTLQPIIKITMPPLEFTRCRSPSSEIFSAIEDRRTVAGKGDIFSNALLHGDDNELVVMAQRHVIVGTVPLDDSNSQFIENGPDNWHRSKSRKSRYGLDWLNEYFACLCVGPDPSSDSNFKSFLKAEQRLEKSPQKVAVYPIAVYPDRLNSPILVERRRRSLMNHFMFQPVQHDRE